MNDEEKNLRMPRHAIYEDEGGSLESWRGRIVQGSMLQDVVLPSACR